VSKLIEAGDKEKTPAPSTGAGRKETTRKKTGWWNSPNRGKRILSRHPQHDPKNKTGGGIESSLSHP